MNIFTRFLSLFKGRKKAPPITPDFPQLFYDALMQIYVALMQQQGHVLGSPLISTNERFYYFGQLAASLYRTGFPPYDVKTVQTYISQQILQEVLWNIYCRQPPDESIVLIADYIASEGIGMVQNYGKRRKRASAIHRYRTPSYDTPSIGYTDASASYPVSKVPAAPRDVRQRDNGWRTSRGTSSRYH
ncbi:MAG: hypothetical protein ACJ788_22840, partial [Ktedonobacteraceae bacterium]